MKKVDLDFSLQAVPKENRNGFWRMLAVMLGLTFFSASMVSGGTLASGLSFSKMIAIVLIGNLLLGLYTGALAFISAKTGLSTPLLARYAFGEKGSYLSSFLLAITQVGWFGVGVAMFALPVEKVTGMNVYVLIAVAGVLMTTTAFFGIKALTILSVIAVPAIAVLGSTSVVRATESMGGIQALFHYEPQTQMELAVALTICIGSFISAGTLTPDFARFSKSNRGAVLATIIAFFIGNSLMFFFGAVGTIATGQSDISEVMFLQGLIIPAIIVLGLNIWTTNDNALYSSGLGFSNITKIAKSKMVIINGIIGTILAMWLYNNFVSWLTMLGSTLPPIGAIILADFFLVKRGVYDNFTKMKFKTVNWVAMFSWVIGVLAANFLPGIPPINALISSAVFYTVVSIVQLKSFPLLEAKKVGVKQ
ncbi:cytosine permease [Bacillus kwashiorkori]|uniref:cytosine permease n=1 Tax=Bacillus kwashiorkori TaxID=1522318 RepID=UPI0007863A6A|nr:cytosine permease [Bacillus kwashiorkori]